MTLCAQATARIGGGCGHREPGVVIQNRLRHAAEKIEGRYMAIAKGFRRLSRIRLLEAAVRVRKIHAKIMEANLLACDVTVRFAKIRLGVTRTMVQGHKHLAAAQRGLAAQGCYVLAP